MTINQVVFKMFKSNFRRYFLFFLCSTSVITIFFMYATLFTNKEFMDPKNIDPYITSNIIAPSTFIGLFSVFFIAYAQTTFNKFRKPEFGVFKALGCTDKDIRKIILFENSLIAVLSLTSGLVIGSLFARLFHLIIIKLINIQDIPLSLNFESYFYTILFFAGIYTVVILTAIISTLRFEAIDLLKALRKGDKGIIVNPISLIVGIIITILSIIDMIFNYSVNNSNMIIRSLLMCFIGTYLIMSNFAWINEKISRTRKRYYKNILFNTNFKNTFSKTKNVLLISTWLVICTVFFSSFALTLRAYSKIDAVGNNPYDVAYLQSAGFNDIPDDMVNNIVNKGETPLTEHKDLQFIFKNSMILLSESELNTYFKCNFNVKPGHFINLYQFFKNDGYAHDIKDADEIGIDLKNKTINLLSQGSCIKYIFNKSSFIYESKLVVLNNSDYLQIAQNADKAEVWMIRLFNFKDWNKTEGIVDKLSLAIKEHNHGNLDETDITSKITSYKTNINGSSFLLFVLFFVAVLFFLAINVMLHFKLLMDFEREKLKYKKIYKIGITKKEASAVVNKELRVFFFLPALLGIVIAAFYLYVALNSDGQGLYVINALLLIGLIYIALQTLIYTAYKRYYVNKLFNYL